MFQLYRLYLIHYFLNKINGKLQIFSIFKSSKEKDRDKRKKARVIEKEGGRKREEEMYKKTGRS